MTKYSINKELKGLFNGSKVVDGVNIANVAWKTYPWMIIENEENFDDAKQDDFNPILQFITRSELVEKLLNSKYK